MSAPQEQRCPQCGCSIRLLFQCYHSIPALSLRLAFAESSLKAWAKDGEFGPEAEFLVRGNDIRIPDSGLLFFLSRNLRGHDERRRLESLIRGRTVGEAKRRLLQAGCSIDASTTSPDV